MPESGKISFKNIINGFLKTMGGVLKDSAIREGSKIEAVQKEVEVQKVVMSKELLWKVFPFLAIGAIVLFLIGRFK